MRSFITLVCLFSVCSLNAAPPGEKPRDKRTERKDLSRPLDPKEIETRAREQKARESRTDLGNEGAAKRGGETSVSFENKSSSELREEGMKALPNLNHGTGTASKAGRVEAPDAIKDAATLKSAIRRSKLPKAEQAAMIARVDAMLKDMKEPTSVEGFMVLNEMLRQTGALDGKPNSKQAKAFLRELFDRLTDGKSAKEVSEQDLETAKVLSCPVYGCNPGQASPACRKVVRLQQALKAAQIVSEGTIATCLAFMLKPGVAEGAEKEIVIPTGEGQIKVTQLDEPVAEESEQPVTGTPATSDTAKK